MLLIIAVVATIVMIVKDYKRFYVYLLMMIGVLLYWFWMCGGMYGFDVPHIVGLLASIVPVVIFFVTIISRRNENAE